MSLAVEHLNGDTTFLLTFSPTDQCRVVSDKPRRPGTFTILLDPWLTGPTKVWHPKFSLSKHTIPSCIQHLSEIPEPDVVIISQNKPDHCHEATLRQLDPSSKHAIILAEAGAAKTIRGWKHFEPSKIYPLPVFVANKPESIIRFKIPGSYPDAIPGEATIAFIPAKRDMTGLHNAVGITYRPPSTPPQSSYLNTILSNSSSDSSLPIQPTSAPLPLTPPATPPSPATEASSGTNALLFNHRSHHSGSSFSSNSSGPRAFSNGARYERALSILYSPHGVTYPNILPYATTHLVRSAALPLTLLLHSFDHVQNPWYLGGNISAGMPGGLEVAQNLLAKCWISAHDEDKDNTGFSVGKLATKKYTVEEVRALVEQGRKGGKVKMDVRALECGERVILRT